MVAVNPYKWIKMFENSDVQRYINKSRVDVPPHIFATAEACYRNMLTEEDNQCVIEQQKIRAPAARAQLPPDVPALPRPAWLLAQPIALLMREHRPYYGSPLKIISAGERIEAGWWQSLQTRDYFMAEGADHAHYWLYRERPSGGDPAEARWYLHGFFA